MKYLTIVLVLMILFEPVFLGRIHGSIIPFLTFVALCVSMINDFNVSLDKHNHREESKGVKR